MSLPRLTPAASSGTPRRAVVHLGAPKSGTTYLQRALWSNRDALLEAGFHLPGRNARDMFHAAIEVRGSYRQWGLEPAALAGTWKRLSAEARRFPGTTIMSHELLAAATRQQAAGALAMLDGLEVHLVFTARDLVRQVVSEWQERVKNGSTVTFASFAEGIGQQASRGGVGGSFWRYQDAQSVFGRWGADLPEERLHLVIAPRSGASPEELWSRFAAAVGFDAHQITAAAIDGPANPTLGTTQTAILRKVNEAIGDRIVQPNYARTVKRQFAQKLLAAYPSPRPVCPPELYADLRAVGERWVEQISALGWTIHGDLSEMLPAQPADAGAPSPHPDDVDPVAEAAMAAAVIADLLVERQPLRGRPGGDHQRNAARVPLVGRSAPLSALAPLTGLRSRARIAVSIARVLRNRR